MRERGGLEFGQRSSLLRLRRISKQRFVQLLRSTMEVELRRAERVQLLLRIFDGALPKLPSEDELQQQDGVGRQRVGLLPKQEWLGDELRL
jgi:hypothetical protein